jgi:hypothetical protein
MMGILFLLCIKRNSRRLNLHSLERLPCGFALICGGQIALQIAHVCFKLRAQEIDRSPGLLQSS